MLFRSKSLSEAGLAGAPVVVVGCVRTLRRIMAMNITPQAELTGVISAG